MDCKDYVCHVLVDRFFAFLWNRQKHFSSKCFGLGKATALHLLSDRITNIWMRQDRGQSKWPRKNRHNLALRDHFCVFYKISNRLRFTGFFRNTECICCCDRPGDKCTSGFSACDFKPIRKVMQYPGRTVQCLCEIKDGLRTLSHIKKVLLWAALVVQPLGSQNVCAHLSHHEATHAADDPAYSSTDNLARCSKFPADGGTHLSVFLCALVPKNTTSNR